MNTGEKIKAARNAAGFTQKELAEKSGVAEITIRQYETGKREPRNEQLVKLAKILNVNFYDLIGYTEDEQNEHARKAREQTLKDIIAKRNQKNVHINTTITQYEYTVLQYMDQLNIIGQNEAVKQVSLLAKIPEYLKDELSSKENTDNPE